MSDLNAPVADIAAPVDAPAPEAPAAAEPQVFDAEYVSKLRREAANYRQRAQVFEGLDPDSQAAIDALARGVREGDQASVREWVTRQYEAMQAAEEGRPVRGEQGRYAPARPFAGQPQPQAGDDADDRPLTRAELRQVLEEDRRSAAQQAQRQQAAMQLQQEFAALNIDPGSPIGAAVARKAILIKQETGVAPPPAEAYRAVLEEMRAFTTPAAVAPASGVPAAPSGVPGIVDPMANLTPAQRAERRMAHLHSTGQLGS